jgi:hypothetical protein
MVNNNVGVTAESYSVEMESLEDNLFNCVGGSPFLTLSLQQGSNRVKNEIPATIKLNQSSL